MQLNGIGSEHSSDMHHVTNCMHNHTHYKKEVETAGASSAASNARIMQTAGQQEEQFSVYTWLDKALGKGKRLLRALWGSSEAVLSGEAGDKAEESRTPAQIREDSVADSLGANVTGQNNHQPDTSQMLHTPQIAAAAAAITQPQNIEDTPGYSAVKEIGGQQEGLWEKVKVKFKDAAGQLSGYLAKRFSRGEFAGFQAKNSFQAKPEKQKEDLRKSGKYRRDVVEIDSALTEDSYLLDSYDKRGEYSRLSANK